MSEQAGLINAYVCSGGHTTWTRNADEGVTPFIIGCPDCGQRARSQFYRVPQQGQAVSHEWYRPTGGALRKLAVDERDHVDRGGLMLRQVAPEMVADLETWLPAQIEADEQRWAAVLTGGRRNGKATAREHLSRCDAHRYLLRRHYLVHDEEFGGLYCQGCGLGVLGRPSTPRSLEHCPTWRGVALAYQHRPGYRKEWRP